ncbi:FAD-binding oxidoreductase [Streptomyces sp. H27-D2]|uniref:FAD-binding oxidoreductase n=1 Tax=Streptomyces sp. H27-D2 TaxID=3046304 RepID=UPI002DB6A81C|nr:FAD-binding oxidoreductase [Streptomyces sp. H27-D2]MEC4015705.1 FAD-binding oxidoreductase [Streptomyces sp. H27-D2]
MYRRTLLTAGTGLAATAGWLAACSGDSGEAAPTPDGKAGEGTRTRGAAAAGKPKPTGTDWTALGKGLQGHFVRPGDADYATARQLYNTRFDTQRPAAVAYTANTADITECLAFARRHGTPVSIRNGGHSYAGWSSGNGRLVIDVSKLATVRTPSAGTARIGAGAKLIDVYEKLGASGVTIPAGSCPTVGVSGLTMGGGHGVVSRAYGLTCDSMTGATLITADGKTLDCDKTKNPDLFWALRGAGNGNFGVVTELRFKTHQTQQGVAAYLTWPWSKAAAVLRAWQAWGPSQPDEIWSSIHLNATPGHTPTLSVSVFSLGTYGDLQNAIDKLADRAGGPGPASSVSLRRRSYLDAMRSYAGCASSSTTQCHLPGATPGRSPSGILRRETYAARSDFYDRSLSAAGIRTMLDQLEKLGRARGSGAGSIALTALGGAINRVKPTDTAFVHRRSRFLAQYLTSWPAAASGARRTAWLDGVHAAMRRYASGAAYQNYADASLADWRSAYYGPAADRLTRLKKKHDPNRLFDFPQAL